jgi:hypothetical protein
MDTERQEVIKGFLLQNKDLWPEIEAKYTNSIQGHRNGEKEIVRRARAAGLYSPKTFQGDVLQGLRNQLKRMKARANQ